jgi:hypothetical protein
MVSVKRDDHFSSDEEIVDDIPLVADASESDAPPPPPPPPAVALAPPAPIPAVPLTTWHVSCVSGTFGSTIKQMRFLSDSDEWLYSADPRDVGGVPSYVISEPREGAIYGRVELGKIPAYTLILSTEAGEVDVLGLAWGTGSVKFGFCAAGVKSPGKDDRLAFGVFAGMEMLPEVRLFLSKPIPVNEKGKPVRHPELPELSEPSDKNFVIQDTRAITHVKIYKMAEKFFSVQASSVFPALVAFGFAIAVLAK